MNKKLTTSQDVVHWAQNDSIDMPECFGKFSCQDKLCLAYCALAMKCCVLKAHNPNLDFLDTILNHPHYPSKLH